MMWLTGTGATSQAAVPCLLCKVLGGADETPFGGLFPHEDRRAQIIAAGTHAAVLIDVAPLGTGHCLVIPRRHALSLSMLTRSEFVELRWFASEVANGLEATTQTPVVLFEHGQVSYDPTSKRSSSCGVSHAHLHILVHSRGIGRAKEACDLTSIAEPADLLQSPLARQNYVYVEGFRSGQHIGAAQGRPSQFLRHVFADGLSGTPASWHWHDQILFADHFRTRERVLSNIALLRAILDPSPYDSPSPNSHLPHQSLV